ncbi:MAG: hypothetical protein GX818_08175, partial [Tissierellia bacterium]|nr:hypothetical protein [Tissierellia bacterium]
LISKLLPQIVDNLSNITSFIMSGDVDIAQIVTDLRNKIDNQYVQYITDYILQASESIREIVNKLLIQLYNIVMSLISNLGSSTLTLVTSFIINIYMLSEKEDILARGRRFIHAYYDDKKS